MKRFVGRLSYKTKRITHFDDCLFGACMRIGIYFISALLTSYVFSYVTCILAVMSFEKAGDDPGSPGILLFGLRCLYGILSLVAMAVMEVRARRHKKEFPVKFSALIFLFTYFPIHIIGICFSPDKLLGPLEGPVMTVTGIMMDFSYMPFFHMTTQGFINLWGFAKRQELVGNRYPKFFVLAFFGAIVLLVGWLI